MRKRTAAATASPDPMIDVVSVEPIGGYRLRVGFSDGSTGVHDFSATAARDGEMVRPLKDPKFFAHVFIELGALTWPNGFDLDPIALHDRMAAAGELAREAVEHNAAEDSDDKSASPRKIMPSAFMRLLRPEYYSDTKDHVSYVLDEATLDHRLETITSRNETHDFELFARKLCERAICPNLRPQTGPEGGGDSKADSETYPVADEISRFYIGEANSGRERWAFAFSAKKTWADKACSDVLGLVETGRPYDRVICVTSRYARSRDRARVEDELSKRHGVRITIHDRSWIMKEVLENGRKDLAYNYLHVGETKDDPLRLGPKDYSRTQQLADIERSLNDVTAYQGAESQRVTEALVAAKLSRNLERPRIETDGRFDRAIRLADQGSWYRQQLEARYERLWTAFWYFDDLQLVNTSYDAFETFALKTDHAANVQFLCNLFQALMNAVTHGHLSREECKLDARLARLRQALEAIAAKTERPNNSLEAEASLLLLRLNSAVIDGREEDLPSIWRDYGRVLERATGLREFNADRLVEMIGIVGGVAGNDPAYNELTEKLADFVTERKGEAEGALILLTRAKQLDFSDRIDMIRLLGKAAYGLSKREYSEHLIEALHQLMFAYRSAGLLWAARATCIMAAASIAIEGEEEAIIPVAFIPTTKVWAWIAVGLRHLPDFILAIEILVGMLKATPLTADSKERLQKDVCELEFALGCILLNLDDPELRLLESLPDILERLELYTARAALLYVLGYADVLREDGSIPNEESDKDIHGIFSALASQPLARETRGPLIVNSEGVQTFASTILGMTVEITFIGSSQLTMIAEAILGSLEAFFATAIDHKVISHTEKFRINLIESDSVSKPEIESNASDMAASVVWPSNLPITSQQQRRDIHQFLSLVSGHVLAATCVADDIDGLLHKLFGDDGVQHRMSMILAAPNSYHRIASRYLSRLSDWQDAVRKPYPVKTPHPQLNIVELEVPDSDREEDPLTSHRGLRVRSVIDNPSWDKAGWLGTGYLQLGGVPGIALMFRDRDAGRKIFERWRERFGSADENEEIYLAIIRHLPGQDPSNYVFLVTSNIASERRDASQSIIVASRSMTMTPESPANLQHFLEAYEQFGRFLIMPAVIVNGSLETMTELAILKRAISVKEAENVSEQDLETMALQLRKRR